MENYEQRGPSPEWQAVPLGMEDKEVAQVRANSTAGPAEPSAPHWAAGAYFPKVFRRHWGSA